MPKNIKDKLFRALVFCLFFGAVSAVAAAPVPALELNVQEAILIALENNLDFQIATLDWKEAKSKLERAQIVGDEEMISEAEKGWEKADKVYGEQQQDLRSFVRTSYQELLESETMVATGQLAKERAESQLAIDENKYKAGLLSTLDIERAQNSLFDAKYRYEKAIIDLETGRMKFNEILGLSLDQQVLLTERLLLDFVPFTLDLKTCYDLALALDPGVASAKENLQKATEAVLVAQSPFTPRVELEKALVNEEKAKIGLQKAEQSLYFKIRAEYYALLEQAHALQVAERSIELERQTLKAEESKYAAGVLSNAQIVAQQEKLAGLEQQYSTELLRYSLSRQKLLQTIGQQEASRGERNED